ASSDCSSGVRSLRYFSRSRLFSWLCAPAALTMARRATRRLRNLRFSPKTGTASPCVSRNTARNTRPMKIHMPMVISWRSARSAAEDIQGQLDAALVQPLEKSRHDARRGELAEHVAFGVEPAALELEDLRGGDDVAFHPVGLLQAHYAAPAVLVPLHLDDDFDGRGNLAAQRADGESNPGHGDHVLNATERIARGVGMNRGERAVVARVHGLQHVERLAAAHFADDDAVGAHAQTVAHEIALRDRAAPFDVGRTGFQPDDVRLAKLQLRRVL